MGLVGLEECLTPPSSPSADADKIRREYEQEMVRLRAQYQAEQDSKAQLQEDLARLRTQFEGQMAQVEAQKEKSSGMAANG